MPPAAAEAPVRLDAFLAGTAFGSMLNECSVATNPDWCCEQGLCRAATALHSSHVAWFASVAVSSFDRLCQRRALFRTLAQSSARALRPKATTACLPPKGITLSGHPCIHFITSILFEALDDDVRCARPLR